MRFLDAIDIYGWDKTREDMVLAALIANLNTLVMGDKGMGKTLLGLRLAEALDVGSRELGLGGVESTKVDGHSANEEDLVGYPLPPDEEEMIEARNNDDPIEMTTALSPNTVAHSEFIVIDEATRIQHHMQSRFLGLMEEGIVDGRKLDVEHIFGAANPISYAGTEVMDEALADRWEFIIPAPEYEEMDAEDRQKIVQTRPNGTHDTPPDPEASARLVEFIQEGRKAFESALENNFARVTQYVDNVACLVNRGLKGKTTADDPDLEANTDDYTTTAPLGARRNSIIMNNIFALFAVSLVRGEEENIARCGEIALKHSLVHALHGDEPIPTETLQVAHETHEGLLQSKEERVISLIENKEGPIERAAMAFRLRARTEDVSWYVQEAHDNLRQGDDDIRRHAFSYVLYNRLQNGDEGLHDLLNQRVMDIIVSDVKDILDAANSFSLNEDSVHPEMGGISEFQKLVTEYNKKKKSPRGRAAIAFAIYSHEQSDTTSNHTNPMSSAKAKGAIHKSVKAGIPTSEDALKEMIEYFTDMSEHQHALKK